jgi:DNA polymerase I-like protein with 3'-5' exonuclease and polymerase domains
MSLLWEQLVDVSDSEARLISSVHDELVMEVREELVEEWAVTLKTCMENAGSVVCKLVPILAEVGVGDTWADAK